MATYTPIKPYGSRWNYRTPSPPPLSVIEPISPVETVIDTAILFPDPSALLNVNTRSFKPTSPRLLSQAEPHSDSTHSILLSSSSPSVSVSRRPSLNPMEGAQGISEVPTFAGNQYFDPLAFFADVALSSADPTTLPKLQKLAAKDAQLMKSTPGDPCSAQVSSQTTILQQTPCQLSTLFTSIDNQSSSPRYFLPPISGFLPPLGPGQFAHSTLNRSTNVLSNSPMQTERVDLAPIRDLTPPSSNASTTGHLDGGLVAETNIPNGLSVSPQQKPAILPSPPLAVYTNAPHSNDESDAFSNSPAKRAKTSQQDIVTLNKTEAVESSTNTEVTSTVDEPSQELTEVTIEQPLRGVKGKKKRRGSKAGTTKATVNQPSPSSKSKKSRIVATPSITLRRSTRNIRYIEEPEDQFITRSPAKVESKHSNNAKNQGNPHRIVLHLSRTRSAEVEESSAVAKDIISTTPPKHQGEAPIETRESLEQGSEPFSVGLSQQNSNPLDQSAYHVGDTSYGTQCFTSQPPESPIPSTSSNTDKDVMTIVEKVQKQLLLNSIGVSVSGDIVNRVDELKNLDQDISQIPTLTTTKDTPIESMSPYHDELTAHDPNFSVDPQVIVEALQRGPPLMSMSPAQLWREIGNARESSLSFEARLPESKLVAADSPNLNNMQQCSPGEERLEKHRFESTITDIVVNDPLVASTEEDSIAPNQEQPQAENVEIVVKDRLQLIDGNESPVEFHKETSIITLKTMDPMPPIIVESSSSVAKEQAQSTCPRSPSPPRNGQPSPSDEISGQSVPFADNFPADEIDDAGCESSEGPESIHSPSDVETENPVGISVSAAHDVELDMYTIADSAGDKTDAVKIGAGATSALEQTRLDPNLPSMEDMDSQLDVDLNGAAVAVPVETGTIETESTPPELLATSLITSQPVVTETMSPEKDYADTATYTQGGSEKTDIPAVELSENLPTELDLSRAEEYEKRAQSEAGCSERELNELNLSKDSGVAIAQEEAVNEAVTTEVETVPERAVPEDTTPERVVPEEIIPEKAVSEEAVSEEAVSEEAVPEEAVPEQAVPEQAVPEQAVSEETTPEKPVPERAVPEQAVAKQAAPEYAATKEAVPEVTVFEEAVPFEATSPEGKSNGAMSTGELSSPTDTLEPMKDLVVPSEYASLTPVLNTLDHVTSIAKNTSEPPGIPDIDDGQISADSDNVINGRESCSPLNNDLCLVCSSTAFTGAESIPVAGQSAGDSPLKWIECDNCKCWTHNACVSLSNEEVDMIDKYHCAMCEKEKGPSTLLRKSTRAKILIDYESLNNGSAVPVQSVTNKMYHPYVDKILNGEFKTVKEEFPRVVPSELTLQFFEDGGGFRLPIVIPAAVNPYPRKSKSSSVQAKLGNPQTPVSSQLNITPSLGVHSSSKQPSAAVDIPVYQKEPGIEVDSLGMGFPEDLTIRQIVDIVGPEETVEVIDVKSQSGDKRKWSLSKWVEYFEEPNREKIYNVISLEVSKSRLGRLIQRPKIVREMDLSDQVWPKDKRKEFPMVQYYCLMSVAHSYTDWHVDFGGSSVYYRILKGSKVFFFLPPTKENLDAYQKWTTSAEQGWTWLAEGRECYRIDLGPGDTMLIPSGWLHAVYTPEDSLVIGGNFLTRLHYVMQFRIHEIERATNTPMKYRFPKFARVHWYDAIKLMQEDPIPRSVDEHLLAGKAANFRNVKGKSNVNISAYLLEGLPAFAEFLRRNSLIAQEIITEGLTKQKMEAVRAAVPKGYEDGWYTVQEFARWVTWKRNCGEVIPSWAYPEADPAEGVPNAGQRKVSAAAIKHMERIKADAERRAAGVVRSGLRDRNQSTQPSVSGASETPAPEENRAPRKRPRLEFGGQIDLIMEPPRKKSRSHKEKLDQSVIDECVAQVVTDFENSGDVVKQAIAVEVRTQYRNVHITRLGPSRSACAPCREGKTKCTHKDDIKALITKVMDLYHKIKGTTNPDKQDPDAEFLGDRSLQIEDQNVYDISEAGVANALVNNTVVTLNKPGEFEVTMSTAAAESSDLPASSGTQVMLNPTKGTFSNVIKRPQNKPLLSKSANDSGEPRRRGGKRTACDACRKSRRKCTHGINGAPSAIDPKLQVELMADRDELMSIQATTVVAQACGGTMQNHSVETGLSISVGEPAIEATVLPEVLEHLAPRVDRAQVTEETTMGESDSQRPGDILLQEPVVVSPPMISEALATPPIVTTPPTDTEAIGTEAIGTEAIGTEAIDTEAIDTEAIDTEAAQRVEEDELPHIQMDINITPGRGKRKRGADMGEENSLLQGLENTWAKKLHSTPSATSSRKIRSAGASFEETRTSPKAMRVDEREASPKGSKTQNTPEKQAWQEMKAVEFGLRSRSKSKSTS